jgi:hypothetical protein
VDIPTTAPLLASLGADGEFATTLREGIGQARGLLERERAEALDEIGVRAAQSRLTYLLAVAADHEIDVTEPVRCRPADGMAC